MSDEIIMLRQTEDDLRQSGGKVLHQYGVHSTYRIHTHDFYELFLVPKGSAIHMINGQSQILTAGSFVLIRPNDVHRYDMLNDGDFEIIDIGIPKEVFLRLCDYLNVERERFDAPALSPHRVLSGAVLEDVRQKLLKTETNEDPETGYRYILSILPYLVSLFIITEEPETSLPRWLSELLGKMDRRENFTTGLPRLLELACMTQEHVTRSFKRYMNMTPTEYINARRLSLAAELLLSGNQSVIDIGELCGFNSPSHFYRLFKQRYGCPPKSFRKLFSSR